MKLNIFYIVLLCLNTFVLKAQLPHDAIYMPKNTVCAVAGFGQSQWKEYWEDKLLRQNFNIGTLTTQSYMLMAAAGITDKLNIIAGLPYISTKASSGNLLGQSGIQDLSVWLKYKLLNNGHGFTLNGALGGSTPLSSYVPDFLPMSIGLQSTTATARIIATYKHSSGLYLSGHGSYTARSNIKVDREAYQAYGKLINQHEVAIPNATDGGIRLGFLNKILQVEAFIERIACIGGDGIRRNDMPFPTNNMNSTLIGAYTKFQPKNVGINTRINQVIAGENVGKAFSFSVGVLYQFNIGKKHMEEMNPAKESDPQK